jgi:hypothetical protein
MAQKYFSNTTQKLWPRRDNNLSRENKTKIESGYLAYLPKTLRRITLMQTNKHALRNRDLQVKIRIGSAEEKEKILHLDCKGTSVHFLTSPILPYFPLVHMYSCKGNLTNIRRILHLSLAKGNPK